MKYRPLKEGRFIKRLNRFLADVEVDGRCEKVHVKNTSRCKELFLEGARVFLEPSDNPDRKTRYSLISLYKGEHVINIDSQVPNQVIYEALLRGDIQEIQDVNFAKREVTWGGSRFDIYYETAQEKGFIEVKGVTLEQDGLGMFPDAPTERGVKHITELTEGLKEGYRNYVCFLLQMDYVHAFRPHHERDLALAKGVYEGQKKGLGVMVYNCQVTPDSIELGVPVELLTRSF